jgi:hypothetical protein
VISAPDDVSIPEVAAIMPQPPADLLFDSSTI